MEIAQWFKDLTSSLSPDALLLRLVTKHDDFDWHKYSVKLAVYCSKYFDKWWNPDKFDWKRGSWALAVYCSYYFPKWWDPERFNWLASPKLANCCSEYFRVWWDPSRYYWIDEGSRFLAQYCYGYFDVWWDPNKFDWRNGSGCLARYCSQHFLKWWDPEKFDEYYVDDLYRSCYEYAHIWERHFKLKKLLME